MAEGFEAAQRFTLAEARVNEKAGVLGFEQGDIARTARRQNGYPDTDRPLPNARK